MSYKVILKVIKGNLEDSEIIFEEQGPCIIGRLPDCALFISAQQDPRISRHHCLLILDPPYARIRDLGSRNGTFVNDEQLSPGELTEDPCAESAVDRELHPGDIVTVGETVFEFQVDPPLDEISSPAPPIQQIQPKRIKLSASQTKVAEPVTGSIPLSPIDPAKAAGGTAIIKPGISVNAYELANMAKNGQLRTLGTETVKDIQMNKKPPVQGPIQTRVKLTLDKSKPESRPSSATPQATPQVQKAKLVSKSAQPQVQKAKLVSQGQQGVSAGPPAQTAPPQQPSVQKAKLVSQPQPQVQKAKVVSKKEKQISQEQTLPSEQDVQDAQSFSPEDSIIYNPLKIQPGQKKKPQRTVKVKIKKLKIK